MKIRFFKFMWRRRYVLLSALALAICAVSAYFLFMKPGIPECRATVRVTNQLKDATLQRILLVSVVPEGAGQAIILLNGSLYSNGVRYNIDRALVVNYQRRGSYYNMKIRENRLNPQDSVASETLSNLLPVVGQQLHLRVEQLDKHHYLFVNNYSPSFVCTSSR
ncbi:hypothetical protein [Serratia ureilytica]|uniref:hypothetical protein n=1 Tax=Serratia ureilytica TaxID=300181 RepID=UPI0018D5F99B|nr:hypothetical protein [Serratia ureilytica]MBH2516907.1 hypothetical protein [Serratia ureilytica]MBH2533138.1 hypothetical protein [Serratia ureilytica]